ncbi:Argininosuccinate lyase [bioreactor metagenome]|uniref:Argininosuccinate lyase n=1 Tax=bioreactor metagenome TaxID=1076179 RepID=A0A645J6K4_9ZZZZ
MPFRDAYKVVGHLVSYCIENEESLETLTLKDFRSICALFDEDVYQALSLKTCVNERKVEGGPSAVSIAHQIGALKERIEMVDEND